MGNPMLSWESTEEMHSLVDSVQLFVSGVWGKVLIYASKQEGGNGREAARRLGRLGWGSASIGGTDP